jgi:hypothetical protein
MSPSAPPPPLRLSSGVPKKRPWYLVLALVFAWIFGASAMTEGCNDISIYKIDRSELVSTWLERARDVDQDAVSKVAARYFEVLDAAKERVFPLGIAWLLLGAAMWGLAAGAMAGRGGARAGLVQVVLVHGALIVLAYTITGDVRRATVDAKMSLAALEPAPTVGEREALRIASEHRATIPLVMMVLHLVGYGLVLLSLTRPRAREFYEANAAARES